MDLRLSGEDIRSWAEFSGDHNPIHFSAEAARAAGLDDVVAHGMLAILAVKDRITDALEGECGLQFSAMFRSPVVRDAPHEAAISPGPRGRTGFKVLGGGQERIRGWICAGSMAAETSPEEPEAIAPEGTALTHDFIRRFPTVGRAWVLLDALAFRRFVRTGLEGIVDALVPALAQAGPDSAPLLVQTSQRVCVATEWARRGIGEVAQRLGSLGYSARLGPVLRGEREVSGAVELTVWAGRDPVVQSELGLLARTRAPVLMYS